MIRCGVSNAVRLEGRPGGDTHSLFMVINLADSTN